MKYNEEFPVVIGRTKYNGTIPKDLHTLPMKMGTSHYISIDKNVLELDFLREIKDFILTNLKKYFVDIVKEPHVQPYVTQSWLNTTEKNQLTHPHRHPNSIVSGVFYTNANDSIIFYNGKTETFGASLSKKYDVATGDLLLFPSSLMHYVPKHEDTFKRTSIAFNTFAHGQFGNPDILTGLNVNYGY
mgnify:CR=1 FL=1